MALTPRTSLRRLSLLGVVSAAAIAAGCTTTATTPNDNAGATRASMLTAADASMKRLYDAVPASREQVRTARATLVCPAIVGGSLTVGVESGRCVLREQGRAAEYYRMTSLSVGLQAGAQSKALYYVFNTQDAVDRFRSSNGWTVGADATAAIASVGANASADTNTAKPGVTGYVLTNAGLEAGVALGGTKFSKLDM